MFILLYVQVNEKTFQDIGISPSELSERITNCIHSGIKISRELYYADSLYTNGLLDEHILPVDPKKSASWAKNPVPFVIRGIIPKDLLIEERHQAVAAACSIIGNSLFPNIHDPESNLVINQAIRHKPREKSQVLRQLHFDYIRKVDVQTSLIVIGCLADVSSAPGLKNFFVTQSILSERMFGTPMTS